MQLREQNGLQPEGEHMPAEVLIAYCTRSGSTAEVAEAISETMKRAGLLVDVKPMAEVQ